jgi:ABC-type spermidine/putrescine transport system permease subunit II
MRRHAEASLLIPALGLLIPIVGLSAGWPLARVIIEVARELAVGGRETLWPRASLVASTVLWAGGVALLATLAAWPQAWLLRARPALAPVLLVPAMLPSYLAYAGWNILRDPLAPLGRWIETQAQHGATWLPVAAGRTLAVLSLTMWAAPIAAVVLAMFLRRLDQSVLDALRLEPAPRARRAIAHARLSLPGLLAAWCVAGLVMLGSAVPFHLAEVPTLAIDIWFALFREPGRAGIYLAVWPIVLAAAPAAWIVSRACVTPAETPSPPFHGKAPAALALTCVLWIVAIVIPLVLFAGSLRHWGSIGVFLRSGSREIASSAGVALAVAVTNMLLALSAWLGIASGSPWGSKVVRAGLFLMLLSGLLPGVLVGNAVLRGADAISPAIADSPWILVLGHAARYGFVALLIGAWLARMEPQDQRDARRLDGATGVAGFLRAALDPGLGGVAGAGLAGGMLSFHEIEASIVLQPPGSGGIAHMILGFLHFARQEEMNAAGVVFLGGSLVLSVAGACAIFWSSRTRNPGGTESVVAWKSKGSTGNT